MKKTTNRLSLLTSLMIKKKTIILLCCCIYSSILHSNELNIGLSSENDISFVFVNIDASKSTTISQEALKSMAQIIKNDLTFSNYFSIIPTKVDSVDTFTLKADKNTLTVMHAPPFTKDAYLFASYPLESKNNNQRIAHKISDNICYEITSKRGLSLTQVIYSKQIQLINNQGQSEWKSEIWRCDYDGMNHEKISSSDIYCITPVFMRHRGMTLNDQFLFVSYILGESKIFLNSHKTLSPFVKLSGNQFLPSCSFNGDKIAFISDISGHVDLFIQNIDPITLTPTSKPFQVFSANNAVQASPSFRPDGKKIAFVSDHEKTPRIYIIDSPDVKKGKRSNYFCLSRKYKENTNPCWSPDGKKIAYSAKIEGIRQIVIYNFLTKEEKQVTFSPIHKENPSWSPSSEHLVFNTIEGNTSELFTFNLKQKKLVQITTGPHKKHYPNWSPYIK